MRKFGEIRCNYFDEDSKTWFVDAWKTANDDEVGIVVATIREDTYEVSYRRREYARDEGVLEAVREKLREIIGCN